MFPAYSELLATSHPLPKTRHASYSQVQGTEFAWQRRIGTPRNRHELDGEHYGSR